MSFFSSLKESIKRGLTRKKRQDAWGERFTNDPATHDGKISLDPGKSELR
jgi:hypothetical protein